MNFPPERWAVDTPLGKALVLFIESEPDDIYWTCVVKETRAIVTFRQNKILMGRSYTDGLGIDDTQMKDLTKCPAVPSSCQSSD